MRALFRGFRFLIFAAMVLLGIFFLLSFSSKAQGASDDNQTNTAHLLTIDGAIGPAVADYLVRGIERANKLNATLVIIKMNTPGGLANSMRDIVIGINNSNIPVASFVTPTGARAASAGTFILYGSHVAAMSPGTNLGAASPVAIGAAESPSSDENEKGEKNNKAVSESKTTLERKVMNDSIAYIRGLAQLRGRNVEFAEDSVSKAASITADEALKKNVIDLVAEDLPELFTKMDGRVVKVHNRDFKINTNNITVIKQDPDARARFLGVITDPSFAYMLMLVGIYGILIEVIYPGMIVPGVLGVISLLVALYAFALLPINYVGLALIIVGIGFMMSEAFYTSYGILGVGGVIAFIIGSIMLIDTDIPSFKIAIEMIVSVAVVMGLTIVILVNMAVRSRFRRSESGKEALIDAPAKVTDAREGHVKIRLAGEIWQAKCDQPLTVGQQVVVRSIDGLVAMVEPKQE